MENTFKSLTQNQKLLWIGQELNPESPMYNMVMTYEIKDAISIPHFKLAFQKLVNNSDALRSIFKLQNGEPVQVFQTHIDYEIEYLDFSNRDNPDVFYKVWEKERALQKFNVEVCLFDSVLVKLEDRRFIWYINNHHLITDGWSTTVVFSKMSQLYKKALEDKLDEVEDFPPYSAFLDYAENLKVSDKQSEASKYWIEKQQKSPSFPALYHKKVGALDTSSKRLHISLGKERSDKIRELAQIKGIRGWSLDLTLYNIFLTALFAYVYRITNQEQLVIGSPTHNRTTKEFREAIGFFVETFTLLTEFEENETFLTLLKKVQLESNSFLKNAQIATSSPELARSFNVFFNYINNVNTDFNEAQVITKWVHPGHMDPRHHLRFHVHDFDNTGDIQLYFDLNTKVFNDEKQQIVPRHFLKILDAFIEDQNQKIETVNFITEAEISKINEWNSTFQAFPEGETLLTKFKEQVLKTPNQTALVFKETSLSYKELDEKSNQVARFLFQNGIKKNDLVVVSLERSLEMMVYIYGILKAGAAYLPVPTLIPSERLNFIVKDANIKVLFYNHNKLNTSNLSSVSSFDVKTIGQQVYALDTSSVDLDVSPNDLAYVIYTSGSTGQPKGVKCHHEGICNRLQWMNNDYPISEFDTFLQKTPITFDVSLWELFWPLQEGAKLVIEVPDGHLNPDGLIKSILQHQVTHIHFVPSVLNVFIQTEGVENCTSLKRIFCSGEALAVPMVEKTFNKLNAEIHNLYGPTEASVDVTSWHCKKEDLVNGIPIGKPVANTQLYILDAALNQLPIGLKGELHIAGKQVAKGYLNRETLTNERFINNVFSTDAHAKMYKTGDLARYRDDGVIEYHGRTDNQIKLRGLRIELGEIEKNIEKYTAISQAIVTVDEAENLVAYYTGEKVDTSNITSVLELKLPLYMIPQFYIHIEAFELLSSGKVDRKKLPKNNVQIKNKTAFNKSSYVSPRNEIDEIIHDVWKEVLGIDVIGVHDNFIRIGGNSLNAISITSRLKSILELDISITDVFNYPTIASYADNIEKVLTELLNE